MSKSTKAQKKNAKKIRNKIIRDKNNKKIIKLKNNLNSDNIVSHSRLKIMLASIFVILILLIFRLFYLQIIDGNHLSQLAYKQQSSTQTINSARGNIYDSTGASLAISETVDTITINPSKLKIKNKTDKDADEVKQIVAEGLSSIFSLDYNEVFEKVNSSSSVETIIKKVEQDKVDELKNWMKETSITAGINIDEDTKRFYPYSTLASHLIGVCGSDNQGLSGIEASFDSILTGTSGKVVTSTYASQYEIPNSEETFIPAENGYDLILTIDVKIQSIAEEYLKQAVEENSCSRGGNVIIMDPSSGDILAMASYPNYDLNSPFTPSVDLASTWDSLSTSEKNTAIQKMWQVRSVSETYEPGSVFKLITSAVALEENITDTDVAGDFYCSGVQDVSGIKIECWRHGNPHLDETLRDALMDSCNPSFVQLSKRIGATTLYKYYDAFGFFSKTNVGLSGEAKGIFYNLEKIGSVELATMSFGQRFTITPLQMITAVSAIANDGYLMQPKLVKSLVNTDTGETTNIEDNCVRQVISSETAEKVRSMMKSVVTDGTGQTAKVEGYSVGGKSGTSEPLSSDSDAGYVASFIAISPVENTEVVVLLTLYDPEGEHYHGGQTAGPVVSQMLTEILPHLGIAPDQN